MSKETFRTERVASFAIAGRLGQKRTLFYGFRVPYFYFIVHMFGLNRFELAWFRHPNFRSTNGATEACD